MTDTGRDNSARTAGLARAALASAGVAGALAGLALGLMVHFAAGIDTDGTPAARRLAVLKRQLLTHPGNRAVQDEFRELDYRLRRRSHAARRRVATGAWVLLAATAVCLGALKVAGDLRKALPHPQPVEEDRAAVFRLAKWSRRAVFGVGAAVVVGAAWLAGTSPDILGRPIPLPIDWDAEAKKQWPRFRGPGGLGICRHEGIPDAFDAPAGKGLLWKVEVPLPGHSSPVVWGRRVFITGADKKTRAVYCHDADTGKLLWQRGVKPPSSPAKAPEVMEDTGLAAPTAAVDGRRVFAVFANGDLACFDLDGKPRWATNLDLPENMYGHSASLTTRGGKVIVQYDQGDDAEAGKSELVAFDAGTGRLAWATARPVGASWSSPIVIETPAGPRIVAAGDPWVIGYDPKDGKEIWRADCISGDIGPSPVFAGGTVYAANVGSYLAAIKADGRGVVTDTHVVWKAEDGLPDLCSPLTDGRRVYLLESGGFMTCYDAAKGAKLWEHDLEMTFQASPTLVGERIYLISEDGVVLIVAAAGEFKELGRAKVGEKVVASPAFAPGRMVVRGKKHLFCFGEK